MHGIKDTIRRIAIATALGAAVATGAAGAARADGTWTPATIVGTSPSGRTRVRLPEDVVAEINAWAEGYTEALAEWGAEDGPELDAYYGGLEEGFSYATQTLLARLGYLDPCYRDGDSTDPIDPDATLMDAPGGWDRETFLKYEDASFGSIGQ